MKQFDEFTLHEYLDGTLDATDRQQVEQWLAGSPEARQMLAALQQTFAALEALDDLPLQRDLSVDVVARIETAELAATPRWVRWLLAGQILAVMTLLTVLWPTLQSRFSSSWIALRMVTEQIIWPQFSPAQVFALGERFVAWGTAVWQQLQFPPPSLDLAAGQWGLLLTLTFLAWLAGNRLLFTNQSHQQMRK